VSFLQLEQDTILNAAERSGVVLVFSCPPGRCSICKSKVISGDTVRLVDEIGISQKEKDDGWILSCARSATSNLEIAEYIDANGLFVGNQQVDISDYIDFLNQAINDTMHCIVDAIFQTKV